MIIVKETSQSRFKNIRQHMIENYRITEEDIYAAYKQVNQT